MPRALEVPEAISPTGQASLTPALSAVPPNKLPVRRDSAGVARWGLGQWESPSWSPAASSGVGWFPIIFCVRRPEEGGEARLCSAMYRGQPFALWLGGSFYRTQVFSLLIQPESLGCPPESHRSLEHCLSPHNKSYHHLLDAYGFWLTWNTYNIHEYSVKVPAMYSH